MTTRVPVHRLLAAAALHLIAGAVWAGAQTIERPVIRVRLVPEIKDDLSGVAWNAMTQAFREIWSREGVDVAWADGNEQGPPADVTLPVIFDDRELRKHDPKPAEAFGVTLFAGRSQRILLSVKRAREVISAHRGLADSKDGMTLDIAHGRLIGRIVAHEVGHALLLTLRHSTHGLMSPQLEQRDAPPLGELQFALSASDRERLTTRFTRIEDVGQRADASRDERPAGPAAAAPGAAAMTTITWTDAPPAPSRPRVRR
jgi:hypothetical protein